MIILNHDLINRDLKESIMFVGRKTELEFLNKKYNKKGGQLIVLYGRRRVGKTELIREFAKNKQHIFYSSFETNDKKQLESFSKRLLGFYKDSEFLQSFSSWEDSLRYLLKIKTEKKMLLIIDEFPYMVKGNTSIPSIIQNLWDEYFKEKEIMIVLCGSSMSFIENNILAEKNPLYGRTTGIYKMNPMNIVDSFSFFPDYSFEEKIKAYSILGGIPHYLKQFDRSLTIEDNIKENILTKGCVLYNEVEFLLKQELRETAIYNTLISVIAMGSVKLNEIYQKTEIEKAKIGVYLKNLIDLGIIDRVFPITEKIKVKANVQRGLYKITDYYFKFWYRFLFSNISDLEEGDVDSVYTGYIEKNMSEYIGSIFEEICINYLKKQNKLNNLKIRFQRIGRWWDKNNEVDILAFNSNDEYIFGECKWRNEKIGLSVLKKLEEKSGLFHSKQDIYYIFSKSGFSEGIQNEAKKRSDLFLIDIEKIGHFLK
jgi:AAA+ ATPase superfamily predicted ATPase